MRCDMTSLTIDEHDIGDLNGRVALIIGGTAGIGLHAAKLLVEKHASVFVAGRNEPTEPEWDRAKMQYVRCDVSDWSSLRHAFDEVHRVDMVFANAGILPPEELLHDTFDDHGALIEPKYPAIDVNIRGVLNTVKLAVNAFRRQKSPGSIVITTSSVAYAPELALPTHGAVKSFVRCLD